MNRNLTAITIITAAVLTNAAFAILGQVFNYPGVLKESDRVVLERFHEHQGSVSFWFTVLALSAALFAPIAIGVGKLRSDQYMKLAVPVGIAAAVVQVVGLSRWPLLVVRSSGARFSGRVFAGLGTVSAAMIVVGVVSPLNAGAIDTINFFGYVLWSLWLIWFAVVLVRREEDPMVTTTRVASL